LLRPTAAAAVAAASSASNVRNISRFMIGRGREGSDTRRNGARGGSRRCGSAEGSSTKCQRQGWVSLGRLIARRTQDTRKIKKKEQRDWFLSVLWRWSWSWGPPLTVGFFVLRCYYCCRPHIWYAARYSSGNKLAVDCQFCGQPGAPARRKCGVGRKCRDGLVLLCRTKVVRPEQISFLPLSSLEG
jgi:hypothetical protein